MKTKGFGVIVAVGLLLPCLACLACLGVDIPIVAHILNAEPEILNVTVPNHIEPGSIFGFSFDVRDNNTLDDLTSVKVYYRLPDGNWTEAEPVLGGVTNASTMKGPVPWIGHYNVTVRPVKEADLVA